jgi:hypothetical protein
MFVQENMFFVISLVLAGKCALACLMFLSNIACYAGLICCSLEELTEIVDACKAAGVQVWFDTASSSFTQFTTPGVLMFAHPVVLRLNNFQFMDGVMFMHHSRLPRMRAIIDDASMIAGVRMVTTAFSFQGNDRNQPHPSLLDSQAKN